MAETLHFHSGACPACGPDKSLQRLSGARKKCTSCGLEWGVDLSARRRDPQSSSADEAGYVGASIGAQGGAP